VEPFLEATNPLCQIVAFLPVPLVLRLTMVLRMFKTTRQKEDGSKTTPRSMKGLARIAGATIKLPMDMTLAMTQGLRNAPKLYGDSTVRHMHKVTGVGSGLKAAGKVRKLANQLSF
jgi:hypothetical protein